MLSESWLALPRRLSSPPQTRISSRLHYPLPGAPRVAVLGLPVKIEDNIRCFSHWTCNQIMRFSPEAIAGSLSDLLEIERLRSDGFLLAPCLSLPLVVFSSLRTGILNQQDRECLWHAFGLPFYEQIRDDEGRLLAYECDAHDGFHWVGEEVGTHLARPVLCACGRMATKTPASEQTESAAQATTGS